MPSTVVQLPHPPSPVSSDDEKNSLDHAADDFDSPAEADNQGRYSQVIEKDGARVRVEWTAEEERAVVRKADLYLLPIFAGAPDPLPSPCGGQRLTFSSHCAALFFFFNMDRGEFSPCPPLQVATLIITRSLALPLQATSASRCRAPSSRTST